VALLLLGLSGSLGTSPRAPFFGVWGGFLLLFLLLWITFFVVRVVFWTRRVGRFYGRPGYGAGNSAIAIVRQRYARGEITREQYDQLMTDLTRRRVPP
jgi:putative membrane protein